MPATVTYFPANSAQHAAQRRQTAVLVAQAFPDYYGNDPKAAAARVETLIHWLPATSQIWWFRPAGSKITTSLPAAVALAHRLTVSPPNKLTGLDKSRQAWFVTDFVVDPQHRRQRIGTQFWQTLLGCLGTCLVEVLPRSQAFWNTLKGTPAATFGTLYTDPWLSYWQSQGQFPQFHAPDVPHFLWFGRPVNPTKTAGPVTQKTRQVTIKSES